MKANAEQKEPKRREMDAYMTPLPLAQAICRRLTALGINPKLILEPSAGTGNFIRAAYETWHHARIDAIEPDLNRAGSLTRLRTEAGFTVCTKIDIGTFETAFVAGRPGLILGNPPYSHALEHVRLALDLGHYTAFLLRMSFLASQERVREFWDKQPESGASLRFLIPLAERPSFTGKGTDNSEYAVYVWERGYKGRAEITKHLWVKS